MVRGWGVFGRGGGEGGRVVDCCHTSIQLEYSESEFKILDIHPFPFLGVKHFIGNVQGARKKLPDSLIFTGLLAFFVVS